MSSGNRGIGAAEFIPTVEANLKASGALMCVRAISRTSSIAVSSCTAGAFVAAWKEAAAAGKVAVPPASIVWQN
jgi:hypothetical protein